MSTIEKQIQRIEYIETTVPAGMTLREYARSRPRRRTRWQRLRQLSGVAVRAA